MAQIESPLFLAHVRSATGTAVQQTNCHPFRFGKWIFVHNGRIREFDRVKRTLAFEISSELFPWIEGTTDSEIMFYLSLTLGLTADPVAGLERMVGLVEHVGREKGIEDPIEMTVGVSDGKSTYAVRYSTDGRSRTLFHSKSMHALRELNPRFERFSEDAMVIVSEPLSDLTDYWDEIPESTTVIVRGGELLVCISPSCATVDT